MSKTEYWCVTGNHWTENKVKIFQDVLPHCFYHCGDLSNWENHVDIVREVPDRCPKFWRTWWQEYDHKQVWSWNLVGAENYSRCCLDEGHAGLCRIEVVE